MKKLLYGSILAIIFALAIYIYTPSAASKPAQMTPAQPIAVVIYQCDAGKMIQASYFSGIPEKASDTGGPPKPGGSVALELSDGPSITLQQTISADGVRYSNGDPQKTNSETMVFWSKGRSAMMANGAGDKIYSGCLEVAPDSGSLPNTYATSSRGFSIRYPANFAVDTSYSYTEMGPRYTIGGVKFIVSSSTFSGTNLAPDTYLSVEQMATSSACSAALFLGERVVSATTTDDNTAYSLATSSGAAAGNRYEESVYALPGTNPCFAVRYFIHYGVLGNYPPGVVQPYDDSALSAEFDAMRRSLIIQQ